MKCKPRIRHFPPPKFNSVSVHDVHFIVCAPLILALSGTSVWRPQSRYTVSHRIPAESEMSRQNRATPPQIKVSHLSPDPPVALSSHSQQAGVAAVWWRASRHSLLGSENGSRYRGVSQLQSHQSRYSVQLSSCPSERLTSNFAIPSRRGTLNIYILPYPATKSLQSRSLVEIAMTVGVHSSTRESLTKVFGAAWGRAGGEWRARQKRTHKKYHSFRNHYWGTSR